MKTIYFILFIVIVLSNIIYHSIVELKFYLQEKKMRNKRKEDDEQ